MPASMTNGNTDIVDPLVSGRVLHNEETCKERLSSMSNGSTAGCGLISSTSEVFFTLNGENLGVVCQVSKVGPLYPAIAVHGIGESG
jgi:hypothetical protein